MKVAIRVQKRALVAALQGRLDAVGAAEVQRVVAEAVGPDVLCAVADMSGVDYMSSAGLRVLVALHRKLKQRGGALALAGLHAYCRDVIDIGGLTGVLAQFASCEEAMRSCEQIIREKSCLEHWDALECAKLDCGTFRIIPAGGKDGAAEILGDVKDVLYSRVTEAHLVSKRFSQTEYSIGLGGLGDRVEDYFPIMGEMITIGGTMVWLPTDGQDTPDFLIPRADKGQVMLRTAFNVSITGGFNELLVFDSAEPEGTTIVALYRALFSLARRRRPDFHGALGLAMRAQMASVFGSGIRRSPIKEHAPANGKMVVDPSNLRDWFDSDTAPRHANVTALICGIGADLTGRLTHYDPQELNLVFYLHPANVGGKAELLHHHAVIFSELPMPEKPANLEEEIRLVVSEGEPWAPQGAPGAPLRDDGDFMDMRHLLDRSAIRRALIGVNCLQAFRRG